jgi:hypothetical protein
MFLLGNFVKQMPNTSLVVYVCLSMWKKSGPHKMDVSKISNVGLEFSSSISSGFGQNRKKKTLRLKHLHIQLFLLRN